MMATRTSGMRDMMSAVTWETEWGVRSPEGIVVTKTEEFARKRVADDPSFWTLVTRQVATTPWEEAT
jgi:hypothetical protein